MLNCDQKGFSWMIGWTIFTEAKKSSLQTKSWFRALL